MARIHPKNALYALIIFTTGLLFSWWFSSKITIFINYFSLSSILPRAMLYIASVALMIEITLALPYLLLTNGNINPTNIFKCIRYFFIGIFVLLVGLPVSNLIIPFLANLVDAPLLIPLSWTLVYSISVVYLIVMPLTSLSQEENP